MAMLQKYLANMTYEHIEREYWETFEINQGNDKIKGYPVINISDSYSRPATVEDFESFLKQSFIKYLQGEVERLEKQKYNNQEYKEGVPASHYMEGYDKAISDQITHFTNQIKELEA